MTTIGHSNNQEKRMTITMMIWWIATLSDISRPSVSELKRHTTGEHDVNSKYKNWNVLKIAPYLMSYLGAQHVVRQLHLTALACKEF